LFRDPIIIKKKKFEESLTQKKKVNSKMSRQTLILSADTPFSKSKHNYKHNIAPLLISFSLSLGTA
jgi:peroxiredoxin